jgi:hypothetical protein
MANIPSPTYVWPTTGNVASYTGGTVTLQAANNYSIGAGGGGSGSNSNYTILTTSNGTAPMWQSASGGSGVTVKGIVEATDVKIDGVSMKEMMQQIQDRLAILVPDPAKLEKFAALKASYEHYKLLEKLCTDNPTDDDKI